MAAAQLLRQGLRHIFCALNCVVSRPLGTRNACGFHTANTAFLISFSRAAGVFSRKRGNFPLAMT